ncbi:FUSC family protein [Rhodococcus sp. BP-316]|uniref:FUSC family protein n=1 Tax=Rhodococcus sp. BP-316 TaxID=2739445 RepID=UPI001C9B0CE0|nr:FUSC family protein [Rhodococcus sp. BP-316]MBY6682215.1 FUSC family protein [Rhodococcus sp. BP-316]
MTAPDPSALPPRPRRRRLFVAVPSVEPRWPGGLRAALAFGVPALALLALGFPTEALLTAAGGFAVVYGEGRPFRSRWSVVLWAGLALVLSATVGGLVGQYGDPRNSVVGAVLVVVVLTVLGTVATFVVDALRLGPPGAFFFVLTCAIATIVPQSGVTAWVNSACVALGALWALVVSMAPALRDASKPERDAVAAAERSVTVFGEARTAGDPAVGARHRAAVAVDRAWAALHDAGIPARRIDDPLVLRLRRVHLDFARIIGDAPLDPEHASDTVHVTPDHTPSVPMSRPTIKFRLVRALHVDSHATTTALRVFCASAASGAIAVVAGLGRPDWAVIGAVLVLQQGLDRPRGTVRALHRLVGTAVGVVLFAIVFSLSPSGFVLVLLLMALQFLIELVIARNYGIAVMFITPLALLIGGASHPGAQAWPLATERLVETCIGVVCALASMWVVARHAHRRCLLWCDGRVLDACRRTADLLRTVTPTHPDAMTARRDVQFELVGAAFAAEHAVSDDREWTSARWESHLRVDAAGYDLLSACWRTADGAMLAEPERWADVAPRP